jgi:hypothetical protein
LAGTPIASPNVDGKYITTDLGADWWKENKKITVFLENLANFWQGIILSHYRKWKK